MKTCFTLENQMSPSVYETVSFSRVIERLAGFSGDVCGNQGGRDMGLQVGGELFKTSVDDYFLEYRTGVYNGSGLSMKDHNDAKDFFYCPVNEVLKHKKSSYITVTALK